jgi:pyruvate/2-oxoglutarate dehydrogenase complex dihydrolipoamide dehydrogenase (E3) component
MAQAFSRLGCAVSMVQMDPYLIPVGDADSGALLEDTFRTKENITVRNGRSITEVRRIAMGEQVGVEVATSKGEVLRGERLLVAAGRKIDTSSLRLENAGVKVDRRGAILVDDFLRTSKRHIYACGDVNGNALLSHAAMHQGMLGLMNAMSPPGFRFNFRNYPVPWTVFTDPQVSYVGQTRKQLDAAGVKYDVVEQRYEDYGAAIAEDLGVGYVKAYVSRWGGHIYGVQIVGEGSGEMINEWAMAIQNGIPLRKILMQQHAFPTMGFLTKRIGEQWMMGLMQNNSWLRGLAKRFYRWAA